MGEYPNYRENLAFIYFVRSDVLNSSTRYPFTTVSPQLTYAGKQDHFFKMALLYIK